MGKTKGQKRVELYCILQDITKALKLSVDTDEKVDRLTSIEENLGKLMFQEIVKD